jgi:hypothetical protein
VVWNLLPRLTMRLNLLAIIDMLSTTSDIITVTGPSTLGGGLLRTRGILV